MSSWADTSEPIGQKRKGKPNSFCFLFQVGHPWSKLPGHSVSSHAIEGSSFRFWKCQSLLVSEVLQEQSVQAPSRWHVWVPITFLKPPFASLFDEPKNFSSDLEIRKASSYPSCWTESQMTAMLIRALTLSVRMSQMRPEVGRPPYCHGFASLLLASRQQGETLRYVL